MKSYLAIAALLVSCAAWGGLDSTCLGQCIAQTHDGERCRDQCMVNRGELGDRRYPQQPAFTPKPANFECHAECAYHGYSREACDQICDH